MVDNATTPSACGYGFICADETWFIRQQHGDYVDEARNG